MPLHHAKRSTPCTWPGDKPCAVQRSHRHDHTAPDAGRWWLPNLPPHLAPKLPPRPLHPHPGLWALLGLVLAWAGWQPAAVQAQSTVYRCGNGQYSQQPCPGGTALAVPDAPDARQQQAAQAQAKRDAARAARLRSERQARERAAAAQGAARIGPAPAATPEPAPGRGDRQRRPKQQHRQADHHDARVAQGPGADKPAGRPGGSQKAPPVDRRQAKAPKGGLAQQP